MDFNTFKNLCNYPHNQGTDGCTTQKISIVLLLFSQDLAPSQPLTTNGVFSITIGLSF